MWLAQVYLWGTLCLGLWKATISKWMNNSYIVVRGRGQFLFVVRGHDVLLGFLWPLISFSYLLSSRALTEAGINEQMIRELVLIIFP